MACSNNRSNSLCEATTVVTATYTSQVLTAIDFTPTTTKRFVTSIQCTPGETLRISLLLPSYVPLSPKPTGASIITPFPSPSTSDVIGTVVTTRTFPGTILVTTPAITVTEIFIVLLNQSYHAYATSTLTLSVMTNTQSPETSDAPFTIVVGENGRNEWDSWSDSEKGGLVAGCVVIFLILVFAALCCMLRRRQTWIASNWAVNSHPGVVDGHSHHGYGNGYPWLRGGRV